MRFSVVISTVFALACQPELAPVDQAPAAAEEGARLINGTPEAIGVLAFLNDADTTYDMLNDEVGLDRRAAESIIGHRNGPDGELGWLQDNLFETVQELDDCYYVGASAFNVLEDWALNHGWVASDSDALGVFDRVPFTVNEADATIELANTAGFNFLDDDLGLDRRAVEGIVAARPIATLTDLAGIKYVGTSALTKLKDAAGTVASCDVEGWDTEYIYNGNGAWRDRVPAEFAAVVDEALQTNTWCDDGRGEPWFVKATVDRFNCETKGYTIELGQFMIEYPDVVWYIEFEVDADYDWFISTCEV